MFVSSGADLTQHVTTICVIFQSTVLLGSHVSFRCLFRRIINFDWFQTRQQTNKKPAILNTDFRVLCVAVPIPRGKTGQASEGEIKGKDERVKREKIGRGRIATQTSLKGEWVTLASNLTFSLFFFVMFTRQLVCPGGRITLSTGVLGLPCTGRGVNIFPYKHSRYR